MAIELKAGEASFHHPRMIHGSYANSTDPPRRAAVINVFQPRPPQVFLKRP